MKRLLLIAVCLVSSLALSQATIPVTGVSAAPNGACLAPAVQVDLTTGNFYSCIASWKIDSVSGLPILVASGTWTKFSIGSVFTGSITGSSYATTTACASSTGVCAAAPAGAVSIAAAATTVTVATTAVTASSQIFVQEDSTRGTALSVTCNTTAGRTYSITSRTAATSFVITASGAPSVNPACLSFFIVN